MQIEGKLTRKFIAREITFKGCEKKIGVGFKELRKLKFILKALRRLYVLALRRLNIKKTFPVFSIEFQKN